MFYIVQVCCYDCMKFHSFKICPISDYIYFIKNNYNEYDDYTYFIFNSESKCINIIDGFTLVSRAS